jgi:predicted Holliday junction resolvase-like endonuclease
MSISLDGFVGSDREHPGMAIPEGVELEQWKLDAISKAGAHLMGRVTDQAAPFPSGIVLRVHRPKHS